MSKETRQLVAAAVRAVESKKGEDLVILEMDPDSGAFTDYFVVATGTNPRQVQAICDEVEKQLAPLGARPASVEGYKQAEWALLDYVDFVVHVFSERARRFYDLERLWKSASKLSPADLLKKPARKPAAKKKPAKKAAPARRPKARSLAGKPSRKARGAVKAKSSKSKK